MMNDALTPPEDSVEKVQEQDAAPQLSLGTKIKQAREAANLSIGEIAERLKLSVRQIDALERDDYESLPGIVFARGFVRSYARILKMNDAEIIADLDKFLPLPVDNNTVQGQTVDSNTHSRNVSTQKSPIGFIIIGLFGLCVVGLLVFFLTKGNGSDQTTKFDDQTDVKVGELIEPDHLSSESSGVNIQAPMIVSDAQNASVTDNNQQLVITVPYRSLLKVVDAQGNTLIDKIVPAKSEHAFPNAGAPFSIRIGFAKKATVLYNGTTIDIEKYIHNKTAEFTVPENHNE
ncbi:RodZ domain-containing protein [Neisseria sp. Ec49-e6-T10]|uniref:helix-turn-helix domain-containing protein n=1 Tax=Neisseria sp. Ec49-e6-T10 TaxID=3140744 RepID=UPI003EBE06A0